MADIAKPTVAQKPITDIARSKDTAPTDTSKPVIVTNRPILRDPMMTNDSSGSDKIVSDKLAFGKSTNKINVQPLKDETTETPDSKVTANVESKVSSASTPQPTTEAYSDNPDTDDLSPPESTTEQLAAETETRAKRDTELQILINSKKYLLPINATEQRRTKKFLILGAGLSLLLILIWVDIALDAGLIKLGGAKAITHFFSN